MKKITLLVVLILALALSVVPACSPADALNETVYIQSVYTWNGTGWQHVIGGGIGAEIDPIWSISPSFGITALDIAGWDGHAALTTGIHGVGAGDVVGTTLVQELDSKTLDSSVGKGTWTASGTWKLPAMYFNGDITTDRWTSDESNTLLGTRVASQDHLTGTSNTFIGHHVGAYVTSGSFNCAWGSHALFYIEEGWGNVGVGYQTGGNIVDGNYNVMIGGSSGPAADGSYGLYIDYQESDTPLIYGNFNTDILSFNGRVGIGVNPPTALLHLKAGTTTAGTAPLKLTAGDLLTTPEAGVLEYDGTGIYLTNTNHRRFISQAADSIIESVTVSNSAAETTVFTGALNANELKAHRVYRLSYYGHMDTASAADTVTVRAHINGTTVVTLTSDAGVIADSPFHGETVFTIRTTGGAGTLSAQGSIDIGTKSISSNFPSIAVDTTVVNNITLTFQWSAAKVDNIMSLDQAFLEVLD